MARLDKLGKAKEHGAVARWRSLRGKKGKTGGAVLVPPVSDVPTLAQIGVSKKTATKAKKLNELGDKKRKQIETRLKEQDKPVTPDAVLAAACPASTP